MRNTTGKLEITVRGFKTKPWMLSVECGCNDQQLLLSTTADNNFKPPPISTGLRKYKFKYNKLEIQ